jgi:xanthine dehydrogenase accessory factor
MLAIREDGISVGSVSGGCVEEELTDRVRRGALSAGLPARLSFGVTAEEAGRLGLPCGGRLDLVAERIDAPDALRLVLRALRERRSITRRLCLATGEASLHPPREGPPFQVAEDTLYKTFGPRRQVLLIGANDIARYLIPLAESLDYQVILCDPREDVRRSWDPTVTPVTPGMPDDLVRERARDRRSAVVALTHDPRLDDMALMEALESEAFYVGALGSRRSNASRRKRLRELGLSDPSIARLKGPVGLAIGGRTPPEIALSIAADLVATVHGRSPALAETERNPDSV